MSKRRVYISGRMSGLKEETYKKNFADAERELKSRGLKVFNPARWVWFLRFLPYKWCLIFDLVMMCFCDYVCLQENWKRSKGAKVEKAFADANDMWVFTL